MKRCILAACTMLFATSTLAANRFETGYRTEGSSPPEVERQCGTLLFNTDSTYENGYAWGYGGNFAPDYGAFAEMYSVAYHPICSLVLDLTQIGNQVGQTLDAYVWDSYQGKPGIVLTAVVGVDPGTIAFWPSVSRHVVDTGFENCPVGNLWAGFWGDWVATPPGWFVGADIDGFGGSPATNIAPGLGYPTGWNHVSIVWGPTQAIGIGVEFAEYVHCDIFPGACCLPDGSCYETTDPYDCQSQGGEFVDSDCEPSPCEPTPTKESSWGGIKAYYSSPD